MASPVRTISVENEAKTCVLCDKGTVDEVNLGKLLERDGVVCHYFCMLFASNLPQNGEKDSDGIFGFLTEDILKEVRRVANNKRFYKCKFCRAPGATIGCCIKKCKTQCHFPCGLQRDMNFQFNSSFEAYCVSCRTIPIVKEVPVDTDECPICMHDVACQEACCQEGSKQLLIRGTCCKPTIYHKLCVQNYALNAGLHTFKCPCCHSIDFKNQAALQGIYLPNRDATWEMDAGAFEDLLVDRRCDASQCICDKGRDFDDDDETSDWSLIKCDNCGATSTHLRCSSISIQDASTWICETCSSLKTQIENRNKTVSPPVLNGNNVSNPNQANRTPADVTGRQEASPTPLITEKPNLQSTLSHSRSINSNASGINNSTGCSKRVKGPRTRPSSQEFIHCPIEARHSSISSTSSVCCNIIENRCKANSSSQSSKISSKTAANIQPAKKAELKIKVSTELCTKTKLKNVMKSKDSLKKEKTTAGVTVEILRSEAPFAFSATPQTTETTTKNLKKQMAIIDTKAAKTASKITPKNRQDKKQMYKKTDPCGDNGRAEKGSGKVTTGTPRKSQVKPESSANSDNAAAFSSKSSTTSSSKENEIDTPSVSSSNAAPRKRKSDDIAHQSQVPSSPKSPKTELLPLATVGDKDPCQIRRSTRIPSPKSQWGFKQTPTFRQRATDSGSNAAFFSRDNKKLKMDGEGVNSTNQNEAMDSEDDDDIVILEVIQRFPTSAGEPKTKPNKKITVTAAPASDSERKGKKNQYYCLLS